MEIKDRSARLDATANGLSEQLTEYLQKENVLAKDEKILVTLRVVASSVHIPTEMIEITSSHTKTGFTFVEPAALSQNALRAVLSLFSGRALSILEELLLRKRNNPLSLPISAYDTPTLGYVIEKINHILLKCPIDGSTYRLARGYKSKHHPVIWIQLWEVTGKLSPSYSGPTKKRKQHAGKKD